MGWTCVCNLFSVFSSAWKTIYWEDFVCIFVHSPSTVFLDDCGWYPCFDGGVLWTVFPVSGIMNDEWVSRDHMTCCMTWSRLALELLGSPLPSGRCGELLPIFSSQDGKSPEWVLHWAKWKSFPFSRNLVSMHLLSFVLYKSSKIVTH